MSRKEYARHLKQHFCTVFLDGLMSQDLVIIDIISQTDMSLSVDKGSISFTFTLLDLFHTLTRHAESLNLGLSPSIFIHIARKEFTEFYRELVNPWPMEEFEKHNLGLKLLHKGNSYANCKYELFTIGSNK